MSSEAVIREMRGRIAWITINRSDSHNALNREVREGLLEAFKWAEASADTDVMVLTGAGEKTFCAGGDLKEMCAESLAIPPPDFVPQPGRTIDVSKPIIAAVNGLALAGGFLLTQCADLVVASSTARFGISEARVGRGAPWAAPLPWIVGPRIALELLLTGSSMDAVRAYDVGLVNEIVEPAQLIARTQELAETIAANAPLSVRAGKKMVYAMADHSRSDGYAVAERIWESVYLSADAQEGPRAFSEKRRPVWTGQ